MFGFAKKKPLTRADFVDAANEVERRIVEGDYVGAGQAAAALRKATAANNGPHTPLWADAHFLEARTALALGDYPRALEHMRLASEVHGDDEEIVKMRLTNQMNLGDILSELGELDEAEQVHRRGLQARRKLYGEDHPGYGYGAESLGTVLLRKGDYDEAVKLGRQAVDAFRGGEPHKLRAALVLWMLACKAKDPDRNVLSQLDPEDLETTLDALTTAPGYLFVDASVDLRLEAVELYDDREDKKACLGTAAAQAHAVHRDEERILALERYVRLCEPEDGDFVDALQGLALAYSEIGDVEMATVQYERALEHAVDDQVARVARNFAIFLGEHDHDERAEALFRRGFDAADGDDRARLEGAYGVFLHHRERWDEAVPRLQACIDGLGPSHPDRLSAHAHLQFARNGEACNCDVGLPVALSGFVREVIAAHLPDDLLDTVVVSPEFEISVSLTREPTDDEVEAIQLATNEARRRIREMQHV